MRSSVFFCFLALAVFASAAHLSKSNVFIYSFNTTFYNRFTFTLGFTEFMNSVDLGADCGFHFDENQGEFFFSNLTYFDTWNETLDFSDTELRMMTNMMMVNETTTLYSSNISLVVQSFNESYLQELNLQPGQKFVDYSKKSIDYHIFYTHDWNQTWSQLNIDIENLPFNFFDKKMYNMTAGFIDQFFVNFSDTFNGIKENTTFLSMETDYVGECIYLDMSFSGMKTPGKLFLIYNDIHSTIPELVYFTWQVPGLDNPRTSCGLKLLKEFQETFL